MELAIGCPLCFHDSKRCFETHGFWLRECTHCHHRFAEVDDPDHHIDRVYNDEYFSGGGAGYTDYLSEADLLVAIGARYARILSRYAAETGMLLDVGAAAGFVLKGFVEAGWRGYGLEPNAKMARFAREELHLDVINTTLEQFDGANQYDLVTTIQIAPHFLDPLNCFRKIAQLTKPGGMVLIETWRRDSMTARIFGKNWHEYSPPSVLHWFTKKELEEMMGGLGFAPVASGRPAKWINAKHAKSLARYKLEQMTAGHLLAMSLAILPDSLNLRYPAEDLFWMLCRKE